MSGDDDAGDGNDDDARPPEERWQPPVFIPPFDPVKEAMGGGPAGRRLRRAPSRPAAARPPRCSRGPRGASAPPPSSPR